MYLPETLCAWASHRNCAKTPTIHTTLQIPKQRVEIDWTWTDNCRSYIHSCYIYANMPYKCFLNHRLTHTGRDKKPSICRQHFQIHFLEWKNNGLWLNLLKFIPKYPIDNKPALAQIMACHQTCDKPLSEPMIIVFSDAYMRRSASGSECMSWIGLRCKMALVYW